MLLPLHQMMNLRAVDITDTFIATIGDDKPRRKRKSPRIDALKRALAGAITDALETVRETAQEPAQAAIEPQAAEPPRPTKQPLTRSQINTAAHIAHASLMRMQSLKAQTEEVQEMLRKVVQAQIAERARLVEEARIDEIMLVLMALLALGYI